MSSFSPYSYRISQFSDSISAELNYDSDKYNIDSYYDLFTFLSKPEQRNVYKVSLSQILNYFVKFGIEYDSVCSTEITTTQKFTTVKYVNRHGSQSQYRPATVADLKLKIIDIIKALIKAAIKDSDRSGYRKNDIIYPKYIFTLDTDKNYVNKLNSLSKKIYKELEDFTDFAYAGNITYSMPMYQDGYVPADNVLICPEHTHGIHENMRNAIGYSWSVNAKTYGNTMWEGFANGCYLAKYTGHHYDSAVNPLWGPDGIKTQLIEATGTAAWSKPSGVSCYPNDAVYPNNAIEKNKKKYVSIRYPGRRYRVFYRTN